MSNDLKGRTVSQVIGGRKRRPRPLNAPERHNRTTRLCGISDTYKVNKKRDPATRYPCFSVLIGPGRVVSRTYTETNKEDKLMEAISIRTAALSSWPFFRVVDAKFISLRFGFLASGCPKCSASLYESGAEDGSLGEIISCILCGFRVYSPYLNEYDCMV